MRRAPCRATFLFMMMNQKFENPVTTGDNPEIPIYVGYNFKVLKTEAIGECIEADNSATPPQLLLKFDPAETVWHCRSELDCIG